MYGYDPYSDHYSTSGYSPYDQGRYDDQEPERLRLLAFVDGRLVGSWTERVEESPWAELARQHDRERERRVLPPPPPPVPTYERVLAWLDDVCGDRDAVLSLSGNPLVDEPDLPEFDTPQARARLSAAHVAGGVAWVVAKADGFPGAGGRLTVTRLKEALGLHPSPSTYGKVVQRALVGYRDFEAPRTGRVFELPDLLPLGLPDLLVGQTRRTLSRARDRALEAQDASAA